jgi:hypothetical protein
VPLSKTGFSAACKALRFLPKKQKTTTFSASSSALSHRSTDFLGRSTPAGKETPAGDPGLSQVGMGCAFGTLWGRIFVLTERSAKLTHYLRSAFVAKTGCFVGFLGGEMCQNTNKTGKNRKKPVETEELWLTKRSERMKVNCGTVLRTRMNIDDFSLETRCDSLRG